MKCPVCQEPLDYHTLLEAQLPAYRCRKCEGVWISAREYLRWLKQQPLSLPERTANDTPPTWDVPHIKLCPNCGHFLLRYRVLPHTSFYLDRCGQCNGLWFDKDEWETLVARNLHDKINQFFTQPWQARIRAEEARAMLDSLYLNRFGLDDYSKAKDMRNWLKNHPQRSMLLAFLQADDPYAI
jgi:Zn-finger nucleic acid-binding protein